MNSRPGWTISYYCSDCNDPPGSIEGIQSHILQIGDCAIHESHNFKFGRQVTIGGKNLRVVDHCGKPKRVDIWRGVKPLGKCDCPKIGIVPNQTLYWDD